HGLVVVVLAFVVMNAAVAWLAGAALAVRWACSFRTVPMIGRAEGALLQAACANLDMTLLGVAAAAAALTLLVYAPERHRGVKDVGFVGATLRAERRRHHGI